MESATTENSTFSTPSRDYFFKIDFLRRLLTFAATLVGIIVLLTGKQTEVVGINPITGMPVLRSAKYNDSPAFIYLLTALVVTCFYTIITLVVSFANIRNPSQNPSPSMNVLFHLAIFDIVMAGVMATATGTGAGIAIGAFGNSKANCRHNAGALVVSIVVTINLLLLAILSIYTL